jgi:hypothetical protein
VNAQDQFKLLNRIEELLDQAMFAAGQLPGGKPLTTKIIDAKLLAEAWRSDQEAELPEQL